MLFELGDRFTKLWNRGADVRKLDDVGFRVLGQIAQCGEGIVDFLVV